MPVAHERVRASVLHPLDPAFAAVVDREVDGDGSLPAPYGGEPDAPHQPGSRSDAGGQGSVPLFRAAGRATQRRADRPGIAPRLR